MRYEVCTYENLINERKIISLKKYLAESLGSQKHI